MERTDGRQDYIAKAREAEKCALETVDVVTRNTWLRIAANYRGLATFVQTKSARGFSW
jgi:hypothetical protein